MQVLKSAKFGIYASPIPLGTVVFSASYFATDCSPNFTAAPPPHGGVARLCRYLLATVLTLMGMGYKPMTPEAAQRAGFGWALPYHDHILALFLPQAAFLIAGITSYLISQFNDIFVFQKIRSMDRPRPVVGARLRLDRDIGAGRQHRVLDPAWMVFPWLLGQPGSGGGAPHLIFTYILGTYRIRLAMAFLEAPFMYAARWSCRRKTAAPTKRATTVFAGRPMTLTYPNFAFDIVAGDPQGTRARRGRLTTPHGTLDTPAFIFCATKAAMKACSPAGLREEKTQIILSNTYHLMLQPGADLVAKMGGLHRFMGWDGPMLTNSGGFQIFAWATARSPTRSRAAATSRGPRP